MKTLTSRRAAGVTLLAALAAIWSITAIPALGDHQATYPASAESNNPDFWENYGETQEGEDDWVCAKTDNPNDTGTPYTLGDPPAGHEWRLLVVKAGNDHNDLYWNPTSGNSYAATGQGAGGWSHVIECSRPIPTTTTTEAPTTTTTEAPTTTTEAPTTTTEAPTTTTEAPTTTTEAPTTTTTEPEVSSTSTSSTTSTTVPETTETTESEPEVSPTTVQQTSTTGGSEEVDDDEDTDDTLPFTGVDSDDMAMVALVALAAGSGLLLLTRKSDEARGIHRA